MKQNSKSKTYLTLSIRKDAVLTVGHGGGYYFFPEIQKDFFLPIMYHTLPEYSY